MEPSTTENRVESDAPSTTLIIERYFTVDGWEAYDIEGQTVDVEIGHHKQPGVRAPASWKQNAINIASKLYFATVDGERETSVYDLVHRVARKIADEGLKHGYFKGYEGVAWVGNGCASDLVAEEQAQVFYDELSHLLLNQMAAFNTPVWLNVGVPNRPQVCSACFLLRVDDSMVEGDHSILKWIETESRIFKGGAGAGVSVSKLRSSKEKLSTGGVASGPTSYMRFADAGAGTLKSGGAHRRAAKMVINADDHPDIFDFIQCKVREDERIRALAAAGFNMDPFTAEGEKNIAEATSFQNANLSVAASDEFMRRASTITVDGSWPLIARTTGQPTEVVGAHELLDAVAQAAWRVGDPGMVFLDQVNDWHTTPHVGLISTCNPCGETWQDDDTACNLASLNLAKFFTPDGKLMLEDYRRAIDVMVLAMDITCSFSDLPTPEIERNTRDMRQLGLGYANLGGMLMSLGIPYNSDNGRRLAGSMTALLTGRAYAKSAELAQKMGHYARYDRDNHQRVIAKHIDALAPYPDPDSDWYALDAAAHADWERARRVSAEHGLRNSQVTVIPPTGTTSHFMGCDSSGCEPCFELVTHKGLAGGGTMTLEVDAVDRGLHALGLGHSYAAILRNQGVEAFRSELPREHRSVFDCANDISPEDHVDMVLAIQPFISGAPSKTVNLPESSTPEDIRNIYLRAWQGGAKAICVYRNNSKAAQVLSHTPKASKIEIIPGKTQANSGPHPAPVHLEEAEIEFPVILRGERQRMPKKRRSLTYKMEIGEHEGYITAGEHTSGELGEIFLNGFGKDGSFLQGLMGCFATSVSIALQHGVPLETFARKFIGMEFEPKGATGDPDIPHVKSLVDYIFRWLVDNYSDADTALGMGVMNTASKQRATELLDAAEQGIDLVEIDELSPKGAIMGTKPCPSCGGIMRSSGACFTCPSCGHNTGCG